MSLVTRSSTVERSLHRGGQDPRDRVGPRLADREWTYAVLDAAGSHAAGPLLGLRARAGRTACG